jgi:hypothetical protein
VTVPALILLVVGLALHLGFTRAKGAEVRRLSAQLDALQAQAIDQAGRREQTRALAQRLGGPDLATALQAQREVEPIEFLGRELAAAGLRSLELGTDAVGQTGGLRRTRYFVRAEGHYEAVLRFVRAIELSPRVLSVDGFTIERPAGTSTLDVRIELSIFEPLQGQEA